MNDIIDWAGIGRWLYYNRNATAEDMIGRMILETAEAVLKVPLRIGQMTLHV